MHRIESLFGIRDVALLPDYFKQTMQRSAPTVFNSIAYGVTGTGLTDQAMVDDDALTS
jgi:hypothetical protein